MCINTPRSKILEKDIVIEKRYCRCCGNPFTTMFDVTLCTDCLREEEVRNEREYNRLKEMIK